MTFREKMIELVGKAVVAYITLKFLYWVYRMLICFGPGVKPVDFGKFGEWSIVTGGTDGIGKEYVRQLAKLGQEKVLNRI